MLHSSIPNDTIHTPVLAKKGRVSRHYWFLDAQGIYQYD